MGEVDVLSLGSIHVEVMRAKKDVPHSEVGEYIGPYPSGAPAIFIDAVARLGVDCGFIGFVGNDAFGNLLINRLKSDGVDTHHIGMKQDYTTGTAFVMYYSSGEREFIFHMRHAAEGLLSEKDVDPKYVSHAKMIHISGCSLALTESCRKACYTAAHIAKQSGNMVLFDPNLRPELLDVKEIRDLCAPILKISDVVMPSRDELVMLTGIDDPVEAGKYLLKQGQKIIVIKQGENGATVISKDEEITVPAYDVNEVDSTGAGDIFDGVFTVGLLNGWSLKKCLKYASAAGALKVTRFGLMEGPQSLKELEEFIATSQYKV